MYQESILLCQSHKFTGTKNWSTTSSAPPETCSSFIIKKEPRQVGREQKIYELYINILAYFTTPSILPGFNSLKWNQNLINLYSPIFFAVLWFFVVTCLSCKNYKQKEIVNHLTPTLELITPSLATLLAISTIK